MNKTFIPAMLILIAVYFLHVSGGEFGFYNTIWWYDIMMHILGGVGIATSLHWFFKTLYKKTPYSYSFKKIILLTLIAGILWEGIEAYYDIASAPVGSVDYFIDSSADIINDIIGSVLVVVSIKFIDKR